MNRRGACWRKGFHGGWFELAVDKGLGLDLDAAVSNLGPEVVTSRAGGPSVPD